jgi:hypothetical protein
MRLKTIVLAIALTASPGLSAAQAPQAPAGAPPGGPQTRYCLHVGPVTGSLVQTVQCWTREQWAQEGVDIDREWAREGVGVIG